MVSVYGGAYQTRAVPWSEDEFRGYSKYLGAAEDVGGSGQQQRPAKVTREGANT